MTRALLLLRWFLRPPAGGSAAAPAPWPLRRASRRRSRSAVLAGVGFVALITLALNLALDTVRPEWRDPEYGHRLKRLKPQAASANGRPVVVALGSSRSQMGFSPGHLGLGDGPDAPVVFNFAVAGGGPVHEVLNLKRLLDNGVRPDYLLVEVLPPVLAGQSPAEELMIPARLGYADLARLDPYADDPAKLRRKWALERIAPYHSLRLYLMSHFAGSMLHWKSRQDFLWKQMKPDGWMPYFFADVPAEKRAQGTAEVHAQFVGYFPNYHIAPLPDRAYRDLLELCRRHGIRAAFYVMPESPTYRTWYPPGARELARQYLDGLSREYGVPVFDASDWLDDETAFADGHHLLRRGAEAFSARFGRECVGPWLRGELGR
jgi:hypothetical protein